MKITDLNRLRLLLTVSFILVLLSSGASVDKFTRTVKKEYPIDKDAHLSVYNKYGKIHCTNWNRDVISFEVTITVDAYNEQKAARIFDMIRVDIQGSESEVDDEHEHEELMSGGHD